MEQLYVPFCIDIVTETLSPKAHRQSLAYRMNNMIQAKGLYLPITKPESFSFLC